jgi:hypothetical protein
VEVCTHGVIFESDKNDAPHTHAGLRALLGDYVTMCGALLFAVDIVSDGGKGHFKCKEGLGLGCHLQAWLCLRAHAQLLLGWHFMQSYHGKGPYDAEGGLIKYYIRIEMRLRNRAFTDYLEVGVFLRDCTALTMPAQTSCKAYSQTKQFAISRRVFHTVAECSLPFHNNDMSFSQKAAGAKCAGGYAGSLRGLASALYCVKFESFPHIREGGTESLPMGVPCETGLAAVGPYTLRSVRVSGVHFKGHWRALSCVCRRCTTGDMTAWCHSHGRSVARLQHPAPDVAWELRTKVDRALLGPWIDFELAARLPLTSQALKLAAAEVATAVMEQFPGTYKYTSGAANFVKTRIALEPWARALCTALELEGRTFTEVENFLAALQWKPRAGTLREFVRPPPPP